MNFPDSRKALEDDFDNTMSPLQDAIRSPREVSNASAEIPASMTDQSQRTEEPAASLEHTSAFMQEPSSTEKKN